MSRFYGVAVGRDGGASVRHGKASASAVLYYDTGGTCLHRLTLEGFEQDGEPWVRVVYQGEELIARPFAQIRQVFKGSAWPGLRLDVGELKSGPLGQSGEEIRRALKGES